MSKTGLKQRLFTSVKIITLRLVLFAGINFSDFRN